MDSLKWMSFFFICIITLHSHTYCKHLIHLTHSRDSLASMMWQCWCEIYRKIYMNEYKLIGSTMFSSSSSNNDNSNSSNSELHYSHYQDGDGGDDEDGNTSHTTDSLHSSWFDIYIFNHYYHHYYPVCITITTIIQVMVFGTCMTRACIYSNSSRNSSLFLLEETLIFCSFFCIITAGKLLLLLL